MSSDRQFTASLSRKQAISTTYLKILKGVDGYNYQSKLFAMTIKCPLGLHCLQILHI